MVSAPSENKEELLKELEKFAFRGIPSLSSPRIPSKESGSCFGSEAREAAFEAIAEDENEDDEGRMQNMEVREREKL